MFKINRRVKVSDSALSATKYNKSQEKNKLSKDRIFSIVAGSLIGLAHIAIVLVVIFSFRYYKIYPSLFISVVGVVVCLLAIIDIVFFIGFNHKDLGMRIISSILALLLIVGGTVGAYFLGNVNKSVDTILNDGSDRYETVAGVFCHYDQIEDLNGLEDINNKSVGVVAETETGVTSIGLSILDKNNINYGTVEYLTNMDLYTALIEGKVDVALLPSSFRTLLERDENTDYTNVLNKTRDFYSFSEEVKIEQVVNNKNIAVEPFNILLIGWSRVELGSSVGLADAIIVASVNPKTYTVSMMSIARDSYVPIPCYNNQKDKINSGRSTSRACFIETVEQLVGEEMDFYMEADYDAIVRIVNAIGGVKITNPVEFTLDGAYLPVGTYIADGYQALQFCRERHHMPNGDFDRQQHQKEVIIEVAKTLINSKDISLALKALEAAEGYFTTDLTLNQLTQMFNMILNTKNYTSLSTFDLLDFQQTRMTGYASWYYNYSMELPLWIYKLYNGSIQECVDRMEFVIENNLDTSDQVYTMSFSSLEPYERPLFYSLEYNEKEEHEVMPAYYIDMVGMRAQEVIAWAKENGVTLTINTIKKGSSEYDASKEGLVVYQSTYYGQLVENNPNCTIKVMGDVDTEIEIDIPSFVGYSAEEAEAWCKENGVEFEEVVDEVAESKNDIGIIYRQSYNSEKNKLKVYVYGEGYEIDVESDDPSMGSVSGSGTYAKGSYITIKASPKKGYKFVKWSDGNTQSERQIEVTGDKKYIAYFEKGEEEHKHTRDGGTEVSPTCESDGYIVYHCTECGEELERVKTSSALGHDYGSDGNAETCQRCGKSNPNYVAPDPGPGPSPGGDDEDEEDNPPGGDDNPPVNPQPEVQG